MLKYIVVKIAVFIQQMPFFVSEISIKQMHICIARLIYEIGSYCAEIINEIELIKMQQFSNKFGRLNTLAPRVFGLLLLLCITGNAFGQGWEKYYDFGGIYEIRDIVAAQDEGFIFTGTTADNDLVLYRLNPEGDTVWTVDDVLGPTAEAGNALVEASNGDIIVGGFCNACGDFGDDDAILIRFDRFGNSIWQKSYGTGGNERILDLIELDNGDLVFTGFTDDSDNKDIYIARTAPNGDIIWEETINNNNGDLNDEGRALLQNSDGNIILAASSNIDITTPQPFILSLDGDGNVNWDVLLGDGSSVTEVRDISLARIIGNDGYVICGSKVSQSTSFDFFVAKIDLNGNQIGTENVDGTALRDEANSIKLLKDGNFIIAGSSSTETFKSFPSVVKVSSDLSTFSDRRTLSTEEGNIIIGFLNASAVTGKEEIVVGGYRSERDPASSGVEGSFYAALLPLNLGYFNNVVRGKIFYDQNNNCIFDSNESPLANWKVDLKGLNQDFHATTNEDGEYEIYCSVGSYDLTIVTPNESWSPCINAYTLNLNAQYASSDLDFSVQNVKTCIYPEISIANSYLSPCGTFPYTIQYENTGTQTINNGNVEIAFGDNVTFVDADIPPTNLGNNKWRFNIGELASLESGSFNANVFINCDEPLGAAHIATAEIFPNDLCTDINPAWNESFLEVNSSLDDINETITFETFNSGTGTSSGTQASIIIEDHVIFRVIDPEPIEPGTTDTIQVPANGSTYRFIVPQDSFHPGDSRPTIAIEGFAPGGQTASIGYATQLPEDDYDPFRGISHTENIDINSYPNQFKRGYPKGYDVDHKIDPKSDLTYQINFRNAGTEDAIRVVIRDTISAFLDPSTIQMGPSSHQFSYEIVGNGILKILFEEINLPPGSGADAEGFITYRISQKPGNESGTLIKSSAAIYFNFEAPMYLEPNCHLVWEDLVERIVFVKQPIPTLESIEAFPNPFDEFTTIIIEGDLTINNGQLSVFNTAGQLLKIVKFRGKKIELERNDFPAGALFFHIQNGKQLLATGQLVAN